MLIKTSTSSFIYFEESEHRIVNSSGSPSDGVINNAFSCGNHWVMAPMGSILLFTSTDGLLRIQQHNRLLDVMFASLAVCSETTSSL